jgi:hypothetical protein
VAGHRTHRRERLTVDDQTWTPVRVPVGFDCNRIHALALDGAPLKERLDDTDAATERPIPGGDATGIEIPSSRAASDFAFQGNDLVIYLQRASAGSSTVVVTYRK